MDKYDIVKNIICLVCFFVALIATIVCPFSQGMTLGMVGKLWAAYFVVQLALAILDGSMAQFVTIMMSLFRR